MYFLLIYDYVPNIVERRQPFREAHIKLAGEWIERGELLLGGAFAEPADGAVIVFKVDDRKRVEEFVERDPYIANGLVTAWRIRPWTVVVGAAL